MLYKPRPVPFEGEKITTALAMAEMEKRAIEEHDATGAEYMDLAADGITALILDFLNENQGEIVILCAKGNNSGDAYAVGERLLSKGHQVTALQISNLEESSPLCQSHAKVFCKKGGIILTGDKIKNFSFPSGCLIIDGLLGTGFHGKVEGEMAKLIERVNHLHCGVIAIDIPSGVAGDTGRVEGAAIYADLTIYLGLIKVGHLYNQGYEHVGELAHVNFGISAHYIDELTPFAYLVNPEVIYKNIPRHSRTANKYQVGQVGIVAGCDKYPGAAIIAAHAALRTGAGLVRHYHQEGMGALLTSMAPEVIRTTFSVEAIEEEKDRIKALLVGPGLGRGARVPKMLEAIYAIGQFPLVIDADALFFFEKIDRLAVLTPHRGELCRLLGCSIDVDDLQLLEKTQQFANQHRTTVVVKGAPTTIVSFEGPKVVIPYGNPGMASGGMGDALGGMIASLIAQGMPPREGAILGATLHALAGDRAARCKSEASMTASDLIEAIPHIYTHLT